MAKKKKSTVPKTGKYMGLEYESTCELSFLYFCEELINAGYVDRVERSPSYLLCSPVKHTYKKVMKTITKTVEQTISLGASYTPDYDVYFNSNAIGKFCWELGSPTKWESNLLVAQKVKDGKKVLYKATIEVKPDFSRNSTTPKSMQSMKWCYQVHGVFVNLFRPNNIFSKLFLPEKYKKTERGTPRLIKFKAVSLSDYLKNLKNGKSS